MIETHELAYQHPSSHAIRFEDIRVEKKEAVLLLGESGSGKTTLLHLLGGLLRGYSGQIRIDGVDLQTLDQSALDLFRGHHFGFVFQKNHMVRSLTVEQNVLLSPFLSGKLISREDVDELLASLGLFEKRKSKANQLSEGQAQRVAIARAIIHQPSVLLADEPTSALDHKNCDRVIGLLLEASQQANAALLVATHDQRLTSVLKNQILLDAEPQHK